MIEQYFTFGCGIDNLHRNCYIIIREETREKAREKMFERFGAKWAFQYDSAEAAGVQRGNLKEIL
jgi:hypothetical protein